MKKLIIKVISEELIDEVVKVHNSAFKGFFLTELGPGFLKLYYRSVAEAKDGILIGAYQDDRLIGFCAACTECACFNTRLVKRNIIKFGLIGLKLLCTRPQALIRLSKNLTKSGSVADNGLYAELMSIAVDNEVQNSGAGKALINSLEETLKQRHVTKLSLTTDKLDNENTLAFYKKRGFRPMYVFTAYPDRIMYRLIKDI